jgi:hypothetical protein
MGRVSHGRRGVGECGCRRCVQLRRLAFTCHDTALYSTTGNCQMAHHGDSALGQGHCEIHVQYLTTSAAARHDGCCSASFLSRVAGGDDRTRPDRWDRVSQDRAFEVQTNEVKVRVANKGGYFGI